MILAPPPIVPMYSTRRCFVLAALIGGWWCLIPIFWAASRS